MGSQRVGHDWVNFTSLWLYSTIWSSAILWPHFFSPPHSFCSNYMNYLGVPWTSQLLPVPGPLYLLLPFPETLFPRYSQACSFKSWPLFLSPISLAIFSVSYFITTWQAIGFYLFAYCLCLLSGYVSFMRTRLFVLFMVIFSECKTVPGISHV